jgi:protein subunit release factor B
MEEVHYTKKDFKVEWYSGSGAGGQHRNKHQNCCRIFHPESGLVSNGTGNRSRAANQREAFRNLANKILVWLARKEHKKEINTEVIRNYNGYRNEVHDKASGIKRPYTEIVEAGNMEEMIEGRRLTTC